jgi:hypothetical protein
MSGWLCLDGQRFVLEAPLGSGAGVLMADSCTNCDT